MIKSLLVRAREARAAELGDGEGLEEGFTLIELMVVLLIIAILLAIAIPTFLGVTNSASDRAAQSNLTNALTEAKAIFQNSSSYTGATPAVFTASAPEFSWRTGATNGCAAAQTSTCVSMQVVDVAAANDGLGLIMATYSAKSSTCWYAVDLEANPVSTSGGGVPFIGAGVAPTGATSAGAFYAKKTNSVTATNCEADWAATQAAFGWGASYASPGAAA